MYKVKGKDHLIKDPKSGSVVNTDMDAFKRAKATKRRILEERRKREELEQRVEKLESLLERLIEEKSNG